MTEKCWVMMEGVVCDIIAIQDHAQSYNCPQISAKHIIIDKIVTNTGQGTETGVNMYDNEIIILIFTH